MPAAQVNAIVSGYLNNLEIPHARSEDGRSYRVLSGSTGVYIGFYDFGAHTVVNLKAIVLNGISDDAPIGVLSVINGDLPFTKFCFYPDEGLVTLEYELIGETMDELEFKNAVDAVAFQADDWDERLQTEFKFGGRRHTEDDERAVVAEREV